MDAIPALILTKNRALQTRLLLQSFQANADGLFQPYVIWQATTKEYEQGYFKLQSEVEGVGWYKETYLLHDLYRFLEMVKDGHFALFMDDCIFYKPLKMSASELLDLFDDETWCVSLRLGLNTTDSTDESKPLKTLRKSGDFIKYKYKKYKAYDNYGFYFSWDGVVYNTKEVLKMFKGDDFTNVDNTFAILPQRIEWYMANHRGDCEKGLMCIPKHSHVVSMNYNSTHDGAVFNSCPMDDLNSLYLQEDAVVDLDSIDFNNITGTHDIRPFKLVRK